MADHSQTGAKMKLQPGSLLIAPPAMTDGRFAKSVLLLTHNNQHGAFAICLNKPSRHTAESIREELNIDTDTNLPFQLYWGGPVNHGSIWLVHDNSWKIENTMHVNDEWRITSDESMFHHMADGDLPRTFRLAFGYASWAPGQLDMELSGQPPFSKRSSWVFTEKVNPEWLFETPVDELWDRATKLASTQAIDSWL